MKTGGYVIIDLENVQIRGIAKTIRGIYNAVKNANGHAVLLSGLNVNGTSYGDTFVSAKEETGKFTIVAHGNQIEISSTDEVKTVSYDGGGVIPITDAYGKFGLTRIIDTDNVIGGRFIRLVNQGTNKGGITINALEKVEPLAGNADAATIVAALNGIIADMKEKTLMKK